MVFNEPVNIEVTEDIAFMLLPKIFRPKSTSKIEVLMVVEKLIGVNDR